MEFIAEHGASFTDAQTKLPDFATMLHAHFDTHFCRRRFLLKDSSPINIQNASKKPCRWDAKHTGIQSAFKDFMQTRNLINDKILANADTH